MSLIDSHAHLTSEQLFPEIEIILQKAQEATVRKIVNICTDVLTLERGLKLSEKYPWIYQAAATTPHDVEEEGESFFKTVQQTAEKGLLKAIGETGLDYYYEHSPRALQKHFLRRYLQLALEYRLPVIIHCREAFGDLFGILDAEYQVNGKHASGVLHCFTGTMQEAMEVIKRGWMLSLSGIVSFKKSIALQEVAREIPLDYLLIETDSPYLAPQKQRGKRNEPAFLKEIAQFIAQQRNISEQELIKQTSENAKRLFSF
jgi:TatD DNase family protein